MEQRPIRGETEQLIDRQAGIASQGHQVRGLW
jgi:hypothetical protein